MCSSPNMPATPPPPQDAKDPDVATLKRKKAGTNGTGTILTGASGVSQSSLNTGGNTLLGG